MAYNYRVQDQESTYFLTLTVHQWADVFSRKCYADIIIESLKYCQQAKGLEIYGWVIMTNHIHLLARCTPGHRMSDFLRDFKKYTAKQIMTAIDTNLQESRKRWLLWLFKEQDGFTFWLPGNHAVEVFSKNIFDQKLNYLHQNPVRAGYVHAAEHWVWSSAASNLLELAYWYE